MDARPLLPDDDRARALALLKRFGWNATSFQVLEPDFRYWFDGDEGFVAYVETAGAWVAAGAPVCAAERLAAVAEHFVQAAEAAGRRACFFAVERRFLEATGQPAQLIGEQPVWDPSQWDAALKSSKSLREQLRRARAKGVTIRAASVEELETTDSPARRAVEALVARWLGSRSMAPMGFLVQLHPFSFPLERRYFVAERQGELVGFLSAVPIYARRGWLFEDLLRDPEAPNGTAESLVDFAIRAVAREGCAYATLGLVPLAGPVTGWMRVARRGASRLYDFRGLQSFKAKLKPQAWEPIFLSFPAGGNSFMAVLDGLAAFARGGLLRFGFETLRRGPALVIQLLAALLIPWTLLLALAPTEPWFPSSAVKWAWVAFDAGIAAGMFSLARRWRHGLALLLATLISGDAVLTWVEAALYNFRRAHTPAQWVVIVAALIAPAFAATLLWVSLDHKRRWT